MTSDHNRLRDLAESVERLLTKAQRAALLDVYDIDLALITKLGSQRSAKALHRLGLTAVPSSPSSLTPLGLAVRVIIQEGGR